MKTTTAALLLLFSAFAHAEPFTAPIPGKQWALTFDIGLIKEYRAVGDGNGFKFLAATSSQWGAASTILSFFLERDASGSTKECFETFWGRSSANPLIDKESIRVSEEKTYRMVMYKYKSGQPHVNFYFINDGYCIDVHASLTADMPESEAILRSIGRTLQWQQLRGAK